MTKIVKRGGIWVIKLKSFPRAGDRAVRLVKLACTVAVIAVLPFVMAGVLGTSLDVRGMLRDVIGEKSAAGDCDLEGFPSIQEMTIAAAVSDCDLPGLADIIR